MCDTITHNYTDPHGPGTQGIARIYNGVVILPELQAGAQGRIFDFNEPDLTLSQLSVRSTAIEPRL